MSTRSPICATELHTWDDQGHVMAVGLCRHELRLSTHSSRGLSASWFWVCPNVERCGTARRLSDDEMRHVQQ